MSKLQISTKLDSSKSKFGLSNLNSTAQEINQKVNNDSEVEDHENEFDIYAVKEDLLALGIDIDYEVIGRMQKLGLSQTWANASKAAKSVKKRNPFGMPAVVYKSSDDQRMSTTQVHTAAKERQIEWSEVDAHRIFLVFQRISDPHGNIPFSTRNGVLTLLQSFKIQYARSSTKFIEKMLNQKNKKVRFCFDSNISLIEF